MAELHGGPYKETIDLLEADLRAEKTVSAALERQVEALLKEVESRGPAQNAVSNKTAYGNLSLIWRERPAGYVAAYEIGQIGFEGKGVSPEEAIYRLCEKMIERLPSRNPITPPSVGDRLVIGDGDRGYTVSVIGLHTTSAGEVWIETDEDQFQFNLIRLTPEVRIIRKEQET